VAFEEIEGIAQIPINGTNQQIHCYDPEDQRILIVLPEDISKPMGARTPAQIKILNATEYDASAISGPWEKTLGQPCVLHSGR
jgi:hypothetical protein